MKRLNKKKIIGLVTVAATIAFSLYLVSIPTDTLLDAIGPSNAYLFMYVIAFVGSITTFASIPYPLILISLVAGGLNPLGAGALSAMGVITADIVTFFAARRGSALLPEHLAGSLHKIEQRLENHPKLFLPCLTLYGLLSPLSNDFAVISLSMMRYPFWHVVPALAIGNFGYSIGIAFLGVYAYDWVMGIF